MWIQVNQKALSKFIPNWINMDMVERVHLFNNGLMLHFQSGLEIEIEEGLDWWKNQIDVSKDLR